MIKYCTCGRIGEHCPQCGSISKSPLKQRSAIMSAQIKQDVRYYNCRKCGVEYGFMNNALYDTECYAPKEVHNVAAPKNIEQEIKDLNEAIEFIRLRGGVVDFPNGIMEPDQVIAEQEKAELVIKKIEPELIIRRFNPDKDKFLTLDEEIKLAKESKNENNP